MSEDSTRVCRICNLEQPLDNFNNHPTSKGGKLHTCKDCMRQIKKKYPYSARGKAGYSTEGDVITILRSMGMYATPGKYTLWRFADVVVWGCIRIEVKSAQPTGKYGTCWFNFTAQHRNGIKGDLVVLIYRGTPKTYHVFHADNPMFYGVDGTVRTGLMYRPDRSLVRTKPEHLTPDMMDAARDNWGLVNEVFHEIQGQLTNNQYVSDSDMNNLRGDIQGVRKV